MKKPVRPFLVEWVNCTWRSSLTVCVVNLKWKLTRVRRRWLIKKHSSITIEHRETLKKQTGGRGKFADIVFEFGPADEEWLKENAGKHYQFVNDIFGGSIPREFVPAIQKGFETVHDNWCIGKLSGGQYESACV